MDRASFLLFVRIVLPKRAQEAPPGRSPVAGTKTSCCTQFHCAEWWCVVLNDPPRPRNKHKKKKKSSCAEMSIKKNVPPQRPTALNRHRRNSLQSTPSRAGTLGN